MHTYRSTFNMQTSVAIYKLMYAYVALFHEVVLSLEM